MSAVIAIDGQLCDPGAASISILDRGFLYGDGVFTILRGRGSCAVDLAGHLEQLAADAAQLGLQLPPTPALAATATAVLARLAAERARLRIVVSRGPGSLSARWSDLRAPRVLVIAEPDASPPRTEIRAVLLDEPRLVPSAAFAPKSLSFQPSLIARERAAERGADEGLRLFSDDTVGEGAASNLFAVLPGRGTPRVVTPPALGIRPGVTRRRVLELCAAGGIDAVERPLPRAELLTAAELFVTSSIAGVVPITALDGEAVAAGPVTAQLRLRYERKLEELMES